jgi:Uncharacterized membrane protein, putative virulence factor
LFVVYALLIVSIGYILGYGAEELWLLACIAIMQWFNSLLQFFRSIISAHHHFKLDSFLSVLDKLLMIVLCGYLLYFSVYRTQFDIRWFVYAQILTNVFSVLVAVFFVIKKYSRIQWSESSLKDTLTIIRQSLPYALLIMLMAVYMRTDMLLLERLSDSARAGQYARATRLLDFFNMIGFLFAGILLPMFSRMYANKHPVQPLVHTASVVLIVSSLAVAAFTWSYAADIVQLIYRKPDTTTSYLLMITMLSFPAYSVMYIYSTLLTAYGNLPLLIRLVMIGSFLSILLNLWLIPIYQAKACAWVALAVNGLLAVLYIIYCIKECGLEYNIPKLMKMAVFFILLVVFNTLMKNYQLSIGTAIALNLPVFLLLTYSLGLWNRQLLLQGTKMFVKSKSEI